MSNVDKITVLTGHYGPAAKTFHADGRTEPYKAGKFFSWEELEVSSLDDLAALLTQIQDASRSFIIRGVPTTALNAHEPVRRTKENFKDAPHHWLMLDIDKVSLPSGVEPVSEEALTFILSLLPTEFQNVSFVAQWSSSAGRKPGVGKAHLWFWLKTALGSDELRAWAKTLDGLVDAAVFNTVQPHYTARPIFHGIADPAPIRTLHVKLASDSVSLVVAPRPAPNMTQTLSRPQQTTGSVLQGKIADGREKWLVGERYHILRDAPPDSLEDFAEATWDSFTASCEVDATPGSGNTYTAAIIADKCRYDWEKYERGEFDFQRLPTATLPPFVDRTTPLGEGLAQLQALISGYMDTPRHTAIRITSGAGKTSTACREFVKRHEAARTEGRKLVLHFYLSTHELKNEIAQTLKGMCPDLEIVNVIGRGFGSCERWEIMPALRNLRVSVQRTCCDSNSKDGVKAAVFQKALQCPHFSTCEFQTQFRPADVYLFTKKYLHAAPRDDVTAPDYVIIDEAFIQELIEVHEAGLEDLVKDCLSFPKEAWTALWAVRNALANHASPLAALKRLGHNQSSLTELAEQLNSPRIRRLRTVKAGMPDHDIVSRVVSVGPETVPYLALLALAKEIEHGRDDAYSLVYKDSKLWIRLLRDSLVLRHPLLILDATAEKELLKAVIPHVEFHSVEVPRKTHVIQVHNRRFSKFSMTGSEGKEALLTHIQQLIDRLAPRYPRSLLVTLKALEGTFRLPTTWSTAHYGNIRGVDAYKDSDAVVLLGTYLPPVQAIEHEAGALAACLPETRNFTGAYTKLERTFRVAQGSGSASVWGHPDSFAQLVLEQKREAEMLQAIDRLRLVHSSEPKPVFILSNLPLDLTVDELVTLEHLAGSADYVGQLLDHLGGVVPLRASLLHNRRPDLFPSEKSAEKWAGPYTPKPLIIPIRQTGVKELRAKAVGQKGPSDTRVLVRDDHPAPRAAITHLMGELASYDGPADRDPAIFVDVPGTGEVVGAKIVQYVDPAPFGPYGWKNHPMPADMYWVFNPPQIVRKDRAPRILEAYPFGRFPVN